MSAIDHAHILSVRGLPFRGLDSLRDGKHDSYFILTEKLNGTLADKVHKDWKVDLSMEPSITQKTDMSLQLAEALSYLHKHRIIFRDLKPQNVGISEAEGGIIKLFDFGLCRELPRSCKDSIDDTYDMSGVGTRRYMACKIANEKFYNEKVDVYGWALVSWELLTGEQPHAILGPEEHCMNVCQKGERPNLRAEWPDWLRLSLSQSWCHCIANRWSIERVVCQLRTGIMLLQHQHSPVGVTEFVDADFLQESLCLPTISTYSRSISPNSQVHIPVYDDSSNEEPGYELCEKISPDSAFSTEQNIEACTTNFTICMEDGVEVCFKNTSYVDSKLVDIPNVPMVIRPRCHPMIRRSLYYR